MTQIYMVARKVLNTSTKRCAIAKGTDTRLRGSTNYQVIPFWFSKGEAGTKTKLNVSTRKMLARKLL